MSDSKNIVAGKKDSFSLSDLYNALTSLAETVAIYPSLKKDLAWIEAVQKSVNVCIHNNTDKDGYFVYEMARSPFFQYALSNFILHQNQDYHLGKCSLPATENYPDKSPQKLERDALFDKQRKHLFHVAESLVYPIKAEDVYDYARSCPDFVFVDEITLYYGGAGRTCVDTHMTRLLYSRAEAISFAKKYLVEKAPKINYREIFKALIEFMEDNTPIKSFLARYDIDVLFPHEDIWIGANKFNGILEKEVILRDDFKKIFRSFSGENDWLRPYLRITNQYEEIGVLYNRLYFNFETGCAWQIE
jgi:hypothetical protein